MKWNDIKNDIVKGSYKYSVDLAANGSDYSVQGRILSVEKIKAHEELKDRLYFGAELTDEQKKRQVESKKRADNLGEVLFCSVKEEMTKHFELINDRIQKSILSGGSAVFIHHYINHVINTAYTIEEYCRLASENGNVIIVYNRPDGTVIPNDEHIGEKEA